MLDEIEMLFFSTKVYGTFNQKDLIKVERKSEAMKSFMKNFLLFSLYKKTT